MTIPVESPRATAAIRLSLTTYDRANRPQGKPRETTWGEWAAYLMLRRVRQAKDGELWSPVRLDPDECRRANDHVRGVCALVGDVDDYSPPEEVLGPLRRAGLEFVAHSSHSYTPDTPKYRVAAPLSREVMPAEFPAVWRGFVALYGQGHMDAQCSDVGRAYFTPSTIPKKDREWEPWAEHHEGAPLDPDELMRHAPPPPPPPAESRPLSFPTNGHRPPAEKILDSTLKNTANDARHYRGYHLARQLQANRYSEEEAVPVVLALQRQIQDAGDHPYTEREALASLAAAYKKPAREPWPEKDWQPEAEPPRNGKHAPAHPGGTAGPQPSPSSLAEVIATFRKWLYLQDDGHIKVALAAYAANMMDGDPVWLMIIGAPSSGKTEVVTALDGKPHTRLTSAITGEASLLSGTPTRDKTKGATGGILREIGDRGVLLLKDFTSVLALKFETRALLLAALREIYDGSWHRDMGVDGGKRLSWSGKLGLIAACTEAIDSHHAVIATMGERFIFYRLPKAQEQDAREQARAARRHLRQEPEMRREFSAAIAGLFAGVDFKAPPAALSAEEEERLIDLAVLGARCRSAVERDGRTREILQIPSPEAPARLIGALERLLNGLGVIGVPRHEAWCLLARVTVDSMPALRWAAFQYAAELPHGQPALTAAFATELSHPTSTVGRALQDLNAHGLLTRVKPSPDRWELTDWARELFDRLKPYFRGYPGTDLPFSEGPTEDAPGAWSNDDVPASAGTMEF